MNRGSNHQKIFWDESDYQYLLELILITQEKYGFKIHAFCLMTNHYHLLLETENEHISKIMKQIDEFYTRYFNVKYHRDGALFRGRYKSCEVQEDAYFLQTSRYISLNPVKAGMVEKPEQYKWSSFRTFIGIVTDKVTSTDRTLRYFKDGNCTLYRDFVEAGIRYDCFADRICSDIGEDSEWLPW